MNTSFVLCLFMVLLAAFQCVRCELFSTSACASQARDTVLATGQVWPGWKAVRDYDTDFSSSIDIPVEAQALTSASFQDCACKCANIEACVSYFWFGGSSKTCWMFSSVLFMYNPSQFYFKADGSNAPVPADSILGRSPPKLADPSCSPDGASGIPGKYTIINSNFSTYALDTIGPDLCFYACWAEPTCTAYGQNSTSGCVLYSNIGNGIASIDDVSTGTFSLYACPPLQTTTGLEPCGLNATLGVQRRGAVVFDWYAVPQLDRPGSVSNAYITKSMQGQPADDYFGCNCRCANMTTCVAYTFIPTTYSSGDCWLHSELAFYSEFVQVYRDALGNEQEVPEDTVVGRVIRNDTQSAKPCEVGFRAVRYNATVTLMNETDPLIGSLGFYVGLDLGQCQYVCRNDPLCVVSEWLPGAGDATLCNLYSQVGGPNTAAPEGVTSAVIPYSLCIEELDAFVAQEAAAVSSPPPSLPSPTISAPTASGTGTTDQQQGSQVTDGGASGQKVDGSKTKSSFKVVPAVVGSVVSVAVVAAAALGFFVYRRRQAVQEEEASDVKVILFSPPETGTATGTGTGTSTYGVVGGEGMAIDGLKQGDVFTRSTAYKYGWTDRLDYASVPIEADVNDKQYDTQQGRVIELTGDELRSQVKLLRRGGLLGAGGMAYVFKGTWPERFGPRGVLAVKVLSDGYTSDMNLLAAFSYEAQILASLNHPNIVKLYGCCLEPPTVCLIMELLPCSLKDVLYKRVSTVLTNNSKSSVADLVSPFLLPLNMGSAESGTLITGSTTASSTGTNTSPKPNSSSATGLSVTAEETVTLDVRVMLQVPSDHTSTRTATSDSHPGLSTSTQEASGTDIQRQQQQHPQQSLGCIHKLTMSQVLHIARGITSGLAYLHDKPVVEAALQDATIAATLSSVTHAGPHPVLSSQPSGGRKIVHRDLKPANVLVNSQGVSKISDFGLARENQSTTLHTKNLGFGTLVYMAPELLVARQAGPMGVLATNRVDIYSLGMILWELLMGQPPWTGMGQHAIANSVLSAHRPALPGDTRLGADAVDPSLLPLGSSPEIITQLSTLIKACWHKHEAKRPSAKALLHKVEELCSLNEDNKQ